MRKTLLFLTVGCLLLGSRVMSSAGTFAQFIQQSGGNIAAVMARHRLPGISPFRTFPVGGGLMSYGVDLVDLYRRIVPFVAKVLHGARPGDIPIEQPVKFELVINLKTAKTFGLTIPPTLLAAADEVIE